MGEGIALRWSNEADCAALSAVHADAWRNAYAGIIPGLALERMLAHRGTPWWRALHQAGGAVLVLDLEPGVSGYARLGPGRLRRPGWGEIYELYLRPECQGTGLGRRLFEAALARGRETGRERTVAWALAENTLACRFYRAMRGTEIGRSSDAIGGVQLEKIGFAWS